MLLQALLAAGTPAEAALLALPAAQPLLHMLGFTEAASSAYGANVWLVAAPEGVPSAAAQLAATVRAAAVRNLTQVLHRMQCKSNVHHPAVKAELAFRCTRPIIVPFQACQLCVTSA